MKVLAFDTANSSCSAAVWQKNKIIAYRNQAMVRGHAEHLMGMIGDVLAESGFKFSDLDLLAVTNGPGGFTGLRVGLAAAQGISIASDLVCVGVSTLELIANGISFTEYDDACNLALIDTKRNDIYAQTFIIETDKPGWQPLGRPKAILPQNLADFLKSRLSRAKSLKNRVVITGDATGRAMDFLIESGVEVINGNVAFHTDARGMAAIAINKFVGGMALGSLKPLYIRPPDATLPKNSGSLRP